MSVSLSNDLPAVSARLKSACHILLALDFDGTLAPIRDSPEKVFMPQGTAAILGKLAASQQVSVAIVSGRAVFDLKRKVNLDVTYAGNHGLEIEGPGISFVHSDARMLQETVDHACWDVEAAVQTVRGVRIERKGLTATVHCRQAPVYLREWIEAAVRFTLRPYDSRLTMRPALEAWEICPRLDWTKGSALKFLLDHMGCTCPLLVCAGDDAADEEMFAVRPEAISIRVGPHSPTRARYYVSGPGELLEFLKLFGITVFEGEPETKCRPPGDASVQVLSRMCPAGTRFGAKSV